MATPTETFLKDYKIPDYYFETVDLKNFLRRGEDNILIVLFYETGSTPPLVLDGQELTLVSVHINGKALKEEDYHLDARHLTIQSPDLEIVTKILPQKNTSLEGLYKSSGIFCTQCGAEGFRKITFYQDAGPIAHQVRPHSYIQVYEKGAEVIRMYKTLLGSQGFRKGMDLYFKRHDGQAVMCDDFYAAMRDANDADFANFLLWFYSQAGAPVVKVNTSYNPEGHTFSLKISQEIPPTPGQSVKEPMFIPIAVERRGVCIKLLIDIFDRLVPSLLRGYNAPIHLESDLTDDDLFFLLANDSDEFNRWEAGQILARKLMLSLVDDFQHNKPLVLNSCFVDGFKRILFWTKYAKEPEFVAKTITLPGEGEIMDMMEVADPDAVESFIGKQLASEL
ncbi:aminopeptidase N-like protein [Medicago truncatula]|uniref:Aminopeptidase N-like protein n=1 Tax=Medicago truncatula TaxID=3880 RepID=A0A072TV76_MEDTR|nr:aminopeptidase N-like protein [Medicago truncatula]